MSSPINDGGPAFPYAKEMESIAGLQFSTGMTLRDYFAAKAIPAIYAAAMDESREGSGLFSHPDWRYGLALDSYKMADAMLAARNAGGEA